jgi:hypothetical protein
LRCIAALRSATRSPDCRAHARLRRRSPLESLGHSTALSCASLIVASGAECFMRSASCKRCSRFSRTFVIGFDRISAHCSRSCLPIRSIGLVFLDICQAPSSPSTTGRGSRIFLFVASLRERSGRGATHPADDPSGAPFTHTLTIDIKKSSDDRLGCSGPRCSGAASLG